MFSYQVRLNATGLAGVARRKDSSMMPDALEPRRLFAGTVTVLPNFGPDHRILVTGDAATNEMIFKTFFSNAFEEEED